MGVNISAKNLVELNEIYYRQQLNLLLGWQDKDVVEEMFFQLQDAARAGNNTATVFITSSIGSQEIGYNDMCKVAECIERIFINGGIKVLKNILKLLLGGKPIIKLNCSWS
jgi:hypothetical protein